MVDTPQTNTTQTTGPQYDTPPALIANVIEDGSEFVLIKRNKQGEQSTVYSTGDGPQTRQLLRQVTNELELA